MTLLLADENFPVPSFNILVNKGYDIKHVIVDDASISDVEVMKIAIEEDRVIITFDSDFGELVFRVGMRPKGIIFFRWHDFMPDEPGLFLADLIEDDNMTFEGYFTVIDANQIRQRKL